MNYYILQQDPRIIEQPSLLSCPENIDPIALVGGKKLPVPNTPICLSLSPRSSDYRGCIIDGIVTLFHKYFITELIRLGVDNFQSFPVELTNPEGEIEIAYSLINIIGLIKAVNEKESVMKPRYGGWGANLYSFKIDPAKTMGQRLFRLAEAPTLIIIDEWLREKLLVFNPPGVLMLPTERYDGWG
ncbi:hypothetical protein [Flavobacterium limi]|uniref:Uncharacterized protein n=1 Tax=Flavobacterium limi TaxID=2045105 RepID=A0ABQ1UBF6_9FLAO|nr:hypothetical protein [Flavobacterium limi]GGF14034.1 hypothetical protein GCM10011518_24060 [Flavobacterium limi]